MNTTNQELEKWLGNTEDINIEFKETHIDKRNELPDYCAALANEGGGKLVLGVNDKKVPVGTKIFQGTHHELSHELLQKIKIRINVEEKDYEDKRLIIFHIPSHLAGQPVQGANYRFPMRAGSSLVEMDTQILKRMLNQTQPDFSAEIVTNLSVADLSMTALQNLKRQWAHHSQRKDYQDYDDKKMLHHLELMESERLNYAALILLGSSTVLTKLFPDAEVIFEWRQQPNQVHHDFRKTWRGAFFDVYDSVWESINSRNSRIPFQEGLFQREILAFDQKSVRESLLNAVTHRDYTINGQSIFIEASPVEFSIESPGGFLPGITPENIVYKRQWRNRRLAEVLEKIGLVERSGQGMDDIFEKTIRDGKGIPDLSKSDSYSVRVAIPAQLKDKNFILFLERVMNEKQVSLSFEQIYELEKIREHQKIDKSEFKNKFLEMGLIEHVGKTRGTKYILSRRYYDFSGISAKHTRLKGLQREKVKELILNHLQSGRTCSVSEIYSGFPELKKQDISNLLQELKRGWKITPAGAKKWKLASKLN